MKPILTIGLLCLFLMGCARPISFNVDAEIVPIKSSSISVSAAKAVKNFMAATVRREKSLGVRFEIAGHKFLEQIRISDLMWAEYKNKKTVPLRITVNPDKSFEISLAEFVDESPFRASRVLSKETYLSLRNHHEVINID